MDELIQLFKVRVDHFLVVLVRGQLCCFYTTSGGGPKVTHLRSGFAPPRIWGPRAIRHGSLVVDPKVLGILQYSN